MIELVKLRVYKLHFEHRGALNMINFQDKVSFIWSIAEILRGTYKPEDYGKVFLPLAILRRFDCVLDSTKDEVN
jgi:type I restriction enzyme M protein